MSEPESPAVDPRWLALSKARQQELLDKYRDTNVDFDWWDFLYDDFESDLEELGIEVASDEKRKEIYFSGFYCQGDGARFVATVEDATKFLTAMGHPEWVKWWEDGWSVKSRLVGTNCMTVDVETPVPDNPYDLDDEPLQYHAWQIKTDPPTIGQLIDFSKDVDQKFSALAAELYSDLRNEYEHQTEDDQVIAWILSNAPEELEEEDD